MKVKDALSALHALADAGAAAQSAAYHKAARVYLGVPVPQVEGLVAQWREGATIDARVTLAKGLWDSNIHEARIAAAKLLTQARLRPDAAAWDLICAWVPEFDSWAIADHACTAAAKRLVADPSRLDLVANWTNAPNMWTRRAAFVMTLPWAKMSNPKPADLAVQDRILGWATRAVADRDWFMQKAVASWVRDLSKHDADRARAFVDGPGRGLKTFALKEAARFL